jgi:large subunit ribosomal protein L6
MERTIQIPEKTSIEVDKFKIRVTGPKGKLEKDFYNPIFSKEITIKKENDKIVISSVSNKKKIKAMLGTIEAFTKHMAKGVVEGYENKLKVVYMHFPFTIKISGKEVLINNFLGEKTPRKTKIIGDCKVEVKGDEVTVTGISKDDVGQTSINLERATRIKNRDRRVFQDGIFWLK